MGQKSSKRSLTNMKFSPFDFIFKQMFGFYDCNHKTLFLASLTYEVTFSVVYYIHQLNRYEYNSIKTDLKSGFTSIKSDQSTICWLFIMAAQCSSFQSNSSQPGRGIE